MVVSERVIGTLLKPLAVPLELGMIVSCVLHCTKMLSYRGYHIVSTMQRAVSEKKSVTGKIEVLKKSSFHCSMTDDESLLLGQKIRHFSWARYIEAKEKQNI